MLVWIKGAGDLASGIALRLHHSGFSIIMTDMPVPTAVRRTVAFSEAIRLGSAKVEDVSAERADDSAGIEDCLRRHVIAVVPVTHSVQVMSFRPDVIVDAIIAKKNLGTDINDAPVVIGVGPGFTAGSDCHAVIESKRGHTLGRVILEGQALPNTGIPGDVGGETVRRVLRAPCDGIFHPVRDIGDVVRAGETVASVDGEPIQTPIDGMIRGLLQDGVPVTKGFKSGDIDPRGDSVDYKTVSDKALAIAGGVLEAIMSLSSRR